jgi:hypothetical protein
MKKLTMKGAKGAIQDLEKTYTLDGVAVCKAAMLEWIQGEDEPPYTVADVMALTDQEMEDIARDMEDDYLEQMFWENMEAQVAAMVERKHNSLSQTGRGSTSGLH